MECRVQATVFAGQHRAAAVVVPTVGRIRASALLLGSALGGRNRGHRSNLRTRCICGRREGGESAQRDAWHKSGRMRNA